jgi:PAS domain S-box-containing protein
VIGLLAILVTSICDFSCAHAASGTVTSMVASVENDERFANLMFGLFTGVILTASLYLFFIWIVMRDRGQVFLLLLLLCLGTNVACSNDLLMSQLGVANQAARDMMQNYSVIFSYILSLYFTYYFLELDVNAPNLRLPFHLLAGLLVVVLLYASFNFGPVHFVLSAFGALTIGAVLLTGLICLHIGVSGSFTHVIAFLFFLGGGMTEPLYELGIITDASYASNLQHIAFSLAAIMFAIVIASQFAARQEEKEKALGISNERFTLATKGTHEGLFDWNVKTGEVFFSEQFRKIIGARLENTPQGLKSWLRLIVPADRRIVREALRRFRRNPAVNVINIEYRIPGPNETRRWLHSKAFATRAPGDGHIVRLVGSIGDITARKQSDVALRASEARFRGITEAHPVPIMIVGLQGGTVLYASPGAEQLLGVAQNLLLHEPFERFLTEDKAWTELWGAISRGGDVDLKEITLRRGDGSSLSAALSARRINYMDESAMAIGLYDLTERKHAEAQIARQQEALQQSEKMAALGGLLAGVAHELNNPLSVALGQATLLMEGAADARVASRAEKIFKAADRCSRIVKSFLALARRKEPERRPVELNSIIQASLELLGFQLRTENIEIKQELETNLPAIDGDPDQLTQVITNLILNAAQAMQDWKGPRRLKISSWHDDQQRVFVGVADSGPGVPPEIRTRIFEPFFTTKGNRGGTGVGLSLCLSIVASHGGEMQLEDAPGGGANFIMQLPMTAKARAASGDTDQSRERLPPGLKILLVDDEVELAQTLADLIEPEAAEIDMAANGVVALDKLRKANYDIIVSDLRMPVLDGPGLHAALKKEMPAYLHKIIYVTGDTLSTHVQAFLQENPVPVIEKPYRLDEVRKGIIALLKENESKSSMQKAESALPLPA